MNDAFARLDHGRLARQGFPEVVFSRGKTPDEVASIMEKFVAVTGHALATRCTPDHFTEVRAHLPSAGFDPRSGIASVGRLTAPPGTERFWVAVATGGTSDAAVAEECAQTLEWASLRVQRFYDVGVAGLERLLAVEEELRSAAVCVVIAGMEGALPSVLGARVACPVIAVPTSVGYGANFQGLSALLGMLTSCVPGVSVVNIDNGFGAAAAANRMLRAMAAAASS